MVTSNTFERPLVYIDALAEGHDRGFAFALSYAAQRTLPLRLVSAVDTTAWPFRGRSARARSLADQVADDARKKLAAFERQADKKGLAVTAELLWGPPFVEVIRQVLKHGHDVVIKTMRGPAHGATTAYGPTARRLLRKCPCGVLLVHPGLERIDRVVAALGAEPEAAESDPIDARILRTAAAWAGYSQARLEVLHAWEAYGESMLSQRIPVDELLAYVEQEKAAAQARVQTLVDTLAADTGEAHLHLAEGPPRSVIPVVCSNTAHDLLVMGSVARSGIPGLLLGNTAEAILERLQCSCLVVKPPDFESPIRWINSVVPHE